MTNHIYLGDGARFQKLVNEVVLLPHNTIRLEIK